MSEVWSFRQAGGNVAPSGHTAASLNELSLLLPSGVYTSFRTYPGRRVLRLDEHFDRLEESAALEGARIVLDRGGLRSALSRALETSRFDSARVRITLSVPGAEVFIALEQLTEVPDAAYAHGVGCTLADRSLRRDTPRSKATRFIGEATKVREAASGMNDVLLVADDGSILEGSSSNFFAVLDERLRTADAGVLAGITRHIVLALAEGLAPIELTPVNVSDLPRLQEAFITSVSRAVMPVVTIAETPIGTGTPGPLTRALIDRFARMLDRDLEPIVPGTALGTP